MNILINCLSLRKGGTERVVVNLSNYLSKEHNVTILTMHNDESDYKLDDRVKHLKVDKTEYNKLSSLKKKIKKISVFRFITMKNIIQQEEPDVILCFLPLPSFYVMIMKRICAKIQKIPVILSERGDPNKTFNNKIIFKIMKCLYKKADGFVFQTTDAQKFYESFIKCKTKIIPNPINQNFIRQEISNKRENTIISVGRIEKQKNNKLLINAFERIHQEYQDYKLVFYGKGSLEGELKEHIKEKGLENKIIFKGYSTNLENEIYNAGVFVLSSDFEGMPNALMEAMASGLPCVSTDCPVGGPRELIKNNINGILIPVGDEEQLVVAIKKILDDKNFANQISKQALNIADSLDPKKISKIWEDFIRELAL